MVRLAPEIDEPLIEQPYRRRRRLRRAYLLVILGLLVLFLGWSMVPVLGARNQLLRGRDAMLTGRDALLAGDASGAAEAFERAERAFDRAIGYVEDPALRAIGAVPLLGRTPDALSAMAQAGERVARAGERLAQAAGELPEGVGALAPRGGRIPLEPLERMRAPLSDAHDLLTIASDRLAEAPRSWLVGPAAGARAEFARALDEAYRGVRSTDAVVRALPAFLGAEEPRRYLLGAQNPAELRGTGGFMGAYAIVTAREGKLRLGDFHPIDELRDVPVDAIEPPNPDYAARYDRYGGAGFWRNINMTPDFPSAAIAMERLYEEVTGEPLDGVILADPQALAALLEVTGVVKVPGTDATISAESAVPYLTNEAYGELPSPRARKHLLGEAAAEVFRRFLGSDGKKGDGGAAARDPVGAGRALVEAAADGHLLLHSTDSEVQSALEQTGVAGRLLPPEGDVLAMVGTNAAGNKVDFYAEREIQYRVVLGAGGTAAARATVRMTNDAPQRRQPRYVIGPYDERFGPGENVTILSVFCGTCRWEGFRRDGARDEVALEEELGHRVLQTEVRLGSGATQELVYDWTVERAWEGDPGAGTYRLTVQSQPTIRPTVVSVDIRAPKGTRIVRASPGMDVSGSRATWKGEAGDLMAFEVEFTRPLPARAWGALIRFLDRPVVRFGG